MYNATPPLRAGTATQKIASCARFLARSTVRRSRQLNAPGGGGTPPARRKISAHDQREWAANHFAACLLMPKSWVRRVYFNEGVRDPIRLARRFRVSAAAMRVRLEVLGITPKTEARR